MNSEQLTVKEIKLYDVLGECVLACHPELVEGQSIINISQFSKGIYFVEIKTEKGVERKKVVKEQ